MLINWILTTMTLNANLVTAASWTPHKYYTFHPIGTKVVGIWVNGVEQQLRHSVSWTTLLIWSLNSTKSHIRPNGQSTWWLQMTTWIFLQGFCVHVWVNNKHTRLLLPRAGSNANGYLHVPITASVIQHSNNSIDYFIPSILLEICKCGKWCG